MKKLQDILDRHQTNPITSQCYKELGETIQNHPQPGLQDVVVNLVSTNVHQQLLQLTTARLTGCLGPLEDGLQSECKYVSEFCLKSDMLFSSSKTRLLNVKFLLPLLQAVSLSTRNRILWNLGKHMSTTCDSNFTVDKADSLYYDVVKVWGRRAAAPLLCQTTEQVLVKELPSNYMHMSKCHVFIIAKRFPLLILSVMEKHSYFPPCDIARYVVRQTIPHSLEYIVKRNQQLSKSTMKIILQNHSNAVLDSPASWASILDCKLVKRTLKPENFTSFLTKQMLELKNMHVSYTLMSYLQLLTPSEVSSLMKNVFEVKYCCSLQEKLDFWEENSDLLKLLHASDRSSIAVELDIKNKLSNDWVPLMMCDKSVPKLKHQLTSEQSASERASLVKKLVETAIINDDQNALEDICKFIVTRYRNDKSVLQQFFNTSIDFLLLSDDTWVVVFDAAKKFFNSDDWQTSGAAKLYYVAIKRDDGLSALKEYLKLWLTDQHYFPVSNLQDLDSNLCQTCIQEVFTEANMNDEDKLGHLSQLLELVTKWVAKSTIPAIDDNVKKFVLKLLHTSSYRVRTALEFILANIKTLDIQFIEDCFQAVVDPVLISYLISKDSSIIYSKETAERVGSHILDHGVKGYVKLLMTLRRRGFTDVLQCIATQSQAALADSDTTSMNKVKTAVFLLVLTADYQEFFSVVDPMLPSITNGTIVIPGEEMSFAVNSPLKLSKRQEAIYQGFGWSLSYAELPVVAHERLLHFCVTSDLVLFVRDALYSLCSSLPNENAEKILAILMEQPVSVKKHSLRLLKVVCNVATQEAIIERLINTEKHVTMRIILVHLVITCLNETKSTSMWLVLRHMMEKLTPDDKTIVLEIVHETVPGQFSEEYYHIMLNKSKELIDVDNPAIISGILQKVCNFVIHMSEKFIESLVVEYFMSEMLYSETNVNLHNPISDLLIKYLQGFPASRLQTDQFTNEGSSISILSRRSLEERKLFLKERLNIVTVKGALDVYNVKKGIYPLRNLFMMFIENFCSTCVDPCSNGERILITEYIDTLLTFFGKFNPSAMFSPFILVSLTNIFKTKAGDSSFVLGQEIGNFCDSMTQQSTAPLYCYNLPNAVSDFMNMLTFSSTLELINVLRGILAFTNTCADVSSDGSSHDLQSMFRLMVVAHILPPKWRVKAEFQDFREMFFGLIKNTPVEVFVFNAN